ncbi:hypothetical protein VTK73DRAFT_5758 [Phialemonium thermophilum]|uniref:Uncharacterized protein n=1 Tax=Phialemonium thermophilum TaxID=223376 RepID=A0ABR3V1S2_9PEZI
MRGIASPLSAWRFLGRRGSRSRRQAPGGAPFGWFLVPIGRFCVLFCVLEGVTPFAERVACPWLAGRAERGPAPDLLARSAICCWPAICCSIQPDRLAHACHGRCPLDSVPVRASPIADPFSGPFIRFCVAQDPPQKHRRITPTDDADFHPAKAPSLRSMPRAQTQVLGARGRETGLHALPRPPPGVPLPGPGHARPAQKAAPPGVARRPERSDARGRSPRLHGTHGTE